MSTPWFIAFGVACAVGLGLLLWWMGPPPTCPRCGAEMEYTTILLPTFIGETLLMLPTDVPTGRFVCGH